ncbi:hypothetical protein CF105_18240 [Aeromonas veronii]|uniref:Uncharacterized protein n=3 Tax=Aeromonas veronii TaxID=654 RepID=A0A4S5C5B3_AERVE|nr:hypothetical protein [Aeromonas sp. ZOR0001]THJ38835.1 hypothetical protein E8Q35_21410 [Aeromonas veronii]TNH68643.1 hypothetical protein CF105_18240 [Aeromonas veronii]
MKIDYNTGRQVVEVVVMGSKTLCEWRRHEIPTDLKALRKIVRKPKFVCSKCARSANDKGYLCQPLRLKEE